MNSAEYISLINNPNTITQTQIEQLGAIIDDYPYFQSARIVRLKGLYNQNSFKYNYALKVTAAHTTDRAVLLDLITSDSFITVQKRIQEPEAEAEIILEETPIIEAPAIEAEKKDSIPKENLLKESILTSIKEANTIEIEKVEPEIEKVEKIELEIIEEKTESIIENAPPIEFKLNEKHSFQEWLQLSTLQPIERDVEKEIKVEKQTVLAPKPIIQTPIEPEKTAPVDLQKKKKELLIDKFILASPKISPVRQVNAPVIQIDINKDDHSDLMTETLARIYLEQKKYLKAIQAYQILILKYPEKSSYFADCISDIKNLQQNN
jgi:hypothetical protein